MDRRNFYYKQRVTEAELDNAFDDAEIGIWNLVKDIGLLGVVSGAEVIENAPTNLTVDVLGPCAIYDQAGQRIYFGVTQDQDCALDYLGNPTVPTVGGEKVWVSIHARFARNLQDLRTDGNGDPVYWIRGESFELRVVAGTPAGGGGHVRPAKPTDAILLADIELSEGQTSIVNANIDTSRRDDFQWTLGANIGIDDSGWANIGPAADVQDAFDNVDAVVLDRDGTGDITEDIVPAALGQFLGESGGAWDAYLRNVTLSGPMTAASDGIDIGDATNRVDPHIRLGICYDTLRPDATGRSLGDATRRWDAYLQDVVIGTGGGIVPVDASGTALGDASHTLDAYLDGVTMAAAGRWTGNLIPHATANDLGSTSLQWDIYMNQARVYGWLYPDSPGGANLGSLTDYFGYLYTDEIRIVTGSSTNFLGLKFDAYKTITQRVIDICEAASPQAGVASNWAKKIYETIAGAANRLGWEHSSSATNHLLFVSLDDVPDGANINRIEMWWYQAGGAVAMTANVGYRDEDGTWTNSGGANTISGVGSIVNQSYSFGGGFSVAKDGGAGATPGIMFSAAASQVCALLGVAVSYTLQDIGAAALVN